MVLVSDGAAAREASNGSCSGCAVGSNLPSCFPRRCRCQVGRVWRPASGMHSWAVASWTAATARLQRARQGRATRTGGRTTGMISTKAPTWRMLAAGDGCLLRTAGDRHDGRCLCLGGSIRKCRRVVLEALDAGRHVSIARTEGDALGLPLRCFPVRPCCRQTGPRAAGHAGYLLVPKVRSTYST